LCRTRIRCTVEDYWVDKEERNDLTFLFLIEVEDDRIVCIRLYPACIENLGVRLLGREERLFLQPTMKTTWKTTCKAFDTLVEVEGAVWTITVRS